MDWTNHSLPALRKPAAVEQTRFIRIVKWRWANRVPAVCLFVAAISAVLFSEYLISNEDPEWLQIIAREILAACRDPGTQWMVSLCLAIYVGTFLLLETRRVERATSRAPLAQEPNSGAHGVARSTILHLLPSSILAFSNFWMIGLLVFSLLRYALNYDAAGSTEVPVLLAGIVFGKAVSIWGNWKSQHFARSFSDELCSAGVTPAVQSGVPPRSSTRSGTLRELAGKMPAPLFNAENETARRALTVIFVVLALLAGAALWRPEGAATFQYHGIPRWNGAWDNPNTYGLLMGVGTVLGFGLLVSSFQFSIFSFQRESRRRILCVLLCLFAAAVCGIGLFKSYSRGAWLGTLVGLVYLAIQAFRVSARVASASALSLRPSPPPGAGERMAPRPVRRISYRSCISWFHENRIALSVVFLSVVLLCFWQFRFTEWRPAARAFSAANVNDFSWRNRVSAWGGAVRMMRDRPIFGFGWGDAETVYQKKYRAPRLEETAAIQMNDYFMLGISAGMPALICFAGYLWLVLRESRHLTPTLSPSLDPCGRLPISRRGEGESLSPSAGVQTSFSLLANRHSSFQIICRAGAVVLLVGFWLDGGLFKLAVAPLFWILLELGRAEAPVSEDTQQSVLAGTKFEIGDRRDDCPAECSAHGVPRPTAWSAVLRCAAWVLSATAVVQTVILLTIPAFGVSKSTLAVAQRWLIPPAAKNDFNFLATNVDWSGRKLDVLITHASLANYNRQLVNWQLDDSVYRRYVLMPTILPERDGRMNWRRPLWENFYPGVRHETDIQSAAETVLQRLRQRLKIVADKSDSLGHSPHPPGIDAIWQQQKADSAGFQATGVAALRSVGIPARFAADGHAEFFNNGKWLPVSER